MTMNREKNISIDPEYGFDSRYTDDKERLSESVALMQARLKRMKNLSKEQILRAKMLQLKMEDL